MNVVWGLSAMTFHVQNWADALGWTPVIDQPIGDQVENVFVVGLYDAPQYKHTFESIARAKRKHFHICGTDAMYLLGPELMPGNADFSCGSKALQDELFQKGIKAKVFPDPTKFHFDEPLPMPEQPAISMYLGFHPYKYGIRFAEAAAEILPTVKFHFYGHGTDDEDLQKIFRKSSVHLRFTEHDGSAITAREYLEAGRYVITTVDLPHAIVVPPRFVEIAESIEHALVQSESGPNELAAAYYREYNSLERTEQIAKELGLW